MELIRVNHIDNRNDELLEMTADLLWKVMNKPCKINDIWFSSRLYLLAIEDNEPIGCISVYREGGLIGDLCVRPGYRRKGIGTKLVKKCIELSKNRSNTYIQYNNNASMNLFSKLGFRYAMDRGDKCCLWIQLDSKDKWDSIKQDILDIIKIHNEIDNGEREKLV